MLYRYSNHLEVWKLGSYEVNKNGNVTLYSTGHNQNFRQDSKKTHLEEDSAIISGNDCTMQNGDQKQILKLVEQPLKLVRIGSKSKKQIQYCELSPSGELIAYCVDSTLRMLKLECVSISI